MQIRFLNNLYRDYANQNGLNLHEIKDLIANDENTSNFQESKNISATLMKASIISTIPSEGSEKKLIKLSLKKRWKETIGVAMNIESINKNLNTLINSMTRDIVTTKQSKDLQLSQIANENSLFDNKEELPEQCQNQTNFDKMIERREFVF